MKICCSELSEPPSASTCLLGGLALLPSVSLSVRCLEMDGMEVSATDGDKKKQKQSNLPFSEVQLTREWCEALCTGTTFLCMPSQASGQAGSASAAEGRGKLSVCLTVCQPEVGDLLSRCYFSMDLFGNGPSGRHRTK